MKTSEGAAIQSAAQQPSGLVDLRDGRIDLREGSTLSTIEKEIPPVVTEGGGSGPGQGSVAEPPSGGSGRGPRRRKLIAAGVGLALIAATAAGWIAANRVKSPAQVASETAPPVPSLITYPVETRVLSSDLIVRGTVRYSDPTVVVLAPSLLKPPTQLVSVLPEKGRTLAEGDVALVVSGRPVFVFAGAMPAYRDIGPGTTGEDVRQIEEALKRLGIDPGHVDGLYDAATSRGVASWYSKAGYAPYGPNEAQRAVLGLAHSTLSQATDRMLAARQAKLTARQGAKPAEIVDAKAAITVARQAIATARAARERDSARGLADVATRHAAVQTATVALDDIRRRAALAASGTNASTGLGLTEAQLAQIQQSIDDAAAAVHAAESDLSASTAVAAGIRRSGEAAVEEATTKLAQANVSGGNLSPQQLQDLVNAVRTAQTGLAVAESAAAKDLSVAQADVNNKQATYIAAAKAAASPGNAELQPANSQAQSDLFSAQSVLESTRRAGEANIADAQAKFAAATAAQAAAATPIDAGPAIRAAQAALNLVRAAAAKDNSVADADVVAKTNLFESAKVRLAQAERRLAIAKSGIDPVSGLPVVTPGDLAALANASTQAEIILNVTNADLAATSRAADFSSAASDQAIGDAEAHLASSKARLDALQRPPLATRVLDDAIRVGEAEVARLQTELTKVASTVGVQIPANEIVFLPTLPLRIDDTRIKRGDPATADVMTVSGTHLAVDSSLLTTEAPLTRLDAPVTIEAPDYDFTTKGHISFIADKPGLRGTDAQHIAIELLPDDAPVQLVGASVRITIPTRTTNGEALVVPIAALSVRADGKTQLQVETATGTTRTLLVTPGLSAQGFVAVVPEKGVLAPGDRVIVGNSNPAGSASSSPSDGPSVPSSDVHGPTSPVASSIAGSTVSSAP